MIEGLSRLVSLTAGRAIYPNRLLDVDDLSQIGLIAALAAHRRHPDANRSYLLCRARGAMRKALSAEIEQSQHLVCSLADLGHDHSEFEIQKPAGIERALDSFGGALNRQERHMIRLYYGKALTEAQVARRMSLTQGRVSQIHRAALDKMRAAA